MHSAASLEGRPKSLRGWFVCPVELLPHSLSIQETWRPRFLTTTTLKQTPTRPGSAYRQSSWPSTAHLHDAQSSSLPSHWPTWTKNTLQRSLCTQYTKRAATDARDAAQIVPDCVRHPVPRLRQRRSPQHCQSTPQPCDGPGNVAIRG